MPDEMEELVGAAEKTADFAALLRELKQRSGLSYEALAKRAHLSTSTLHRYCVGEGVPADYATVSRFARVCRATPEEMVELHRRWAVADAARERARRGAGGSVSGAGDQGGAGGQGGAGVGRNDGEARQGGGAGQRAVSAGAGAEAGADAGVGAGAGADAGAGAGGGGEAAGASASASGIEFAPELASGSSCAYDDPPGAAPDTSPETGTRTGTPAEPPVRRGSATRKRWALGAAAAVAVAGLSAVLVLNRNGWVDRTAGRPSSSVSAWGEVSDGPSARQGPTPSPSKSSSGRSSRSRGSGEPDATSSASASGGTGVSSDDARKDPGVPVTVATSAHAWVSPPCGVNYLINRPPDQVSAPPPQQDAPGWVREFGAVAAGEQRVSLTVQGKGDDAVMIKGLYVRVVRSGKPLDWNAYDMATGCGGGVTPRSFDTDLDAGQPIVVPKSGQRGLPYKVSRSDPEELYITARTEDHDVEWYVELQWASGGRQGTILIKDNGKPFRTSGMKGRPQYVHPNGADAWEQPLPQS